MTRYLTRNHQELDRILNSVPRQIRNDRKKLGSEWNGLKNKLKTRNKIIFQNTRKNYRNCKKTHLLYFCEYTIVKFVESGDINGKYATPRYTT